MPAQYQAERAWQFRDEEQTRSSDAFLLWNRDRALRNFVLSLAYFDTLDTEAPLRSSPTNELGDRGEDLRER
jgi:hypothetical protein